MSPRLGELIFQGDDAAGSGHVGVLLAHLVGAGGQAQLEVVGSRETYLGDGGFDPDRLIAQFAATVDAAEHAGYPGIRIIGDLSALVATVASAVLVDYEARVERFVLAVAEILANAIVHGGGAGSLRLRRSDTGLHCRISDAGPGIPAARLTGSRQPPPVSAVGGRGLWLARHVCHVEITTGTAGTTVDLTTPLPSATPTN